MDIKEYKYYLDMHCHYNHLNLNDVKEILKNNEIKLIVNTINIEDYRKYRKWSLEKTPNLYFAYGLYPDNALKKEWKEIEKDLEEIDFEKGIAIGEIGLDFKITENEQIKKRQEKLFEKQLNIANKLKKPVIIHTRGAQKETLEFLKSWQDVQVILHWFTAEKKDIEEALSRGYYLTERFARPKIENIDKYLDQLFIETDSPVNYNGKETTIESIKESYNAFSKKYNIPLEKIKKITINNFKKLFKEIKNE